jgi:hypothetical protein
MIRGEIHGGDAFNHLEGRVREIRDRCDDLEPLGQQVREAIVRGLTRMAQAGVDSQGRKLEPLAESTRRKPGHDGEPLRHGGSPAFLDSLRVEVKRMGSGRIAIEAYFTHPAARITAEGTSHQPARDVFHPDQQTMDEIRAIVAEFARGILGGGQVNRWGHRRLL